ncbi:MAG: DNA-binding transcriptional activator FeaR [Subtercola sp.]|nr:DNA-binding transcriptional activator FeaR [Subtercola sp.]
MSPEATRLVRVPVTFTATLTTVQAGAVALVRLESNAYSARRTLARIATFPVDVVRVIIVLAGAIRVRQDGHTSLVPVERATVLRTAAVYEYVVSHDSDIIIISIPRSRLTLAAHRNLRAVSATEIDRPMLIETIVAFVLPALVMTTGSGRQTAVTYESVLVSFANSVIAADTDTDLESDDAGANAAQPVQGAASAQLVSSATIFLLDHIRSPALTAAAIAADLGVSLRNLYRAFEIENVSVGELIRSTRLDMIAARLRTNNSGQPLSRLAHDYGFSSTDVCARAFKARFGMTMSAYGLVRRPIVAAGL